MRFYTLILAAAAMIVSFIFSVMLGKVVLPLLRKLKVKQTILEIGPSWHKQKQGTPTMGGVIFILAIVITFIAFIPTYYGFYMKDLTANGFFLDKKTLTFSLLNIVCGLMMAISYGLIGFFDDYIKITKRQNLGLTPRQKLVLQFLAAFMFLFIRSFFQITYGFGKITSIRVPFFHQIDLGIFYWVICAIFIVGTVNAVNLTDGIDGLGISVTFFAGAFLLIMALAKNFQLLEIFISIFLGSCLGFFVYNVHPAKVFMGDTGSLFLGGILCAIAFILDAPVFLLLIGAIYYIEMFSVILQVAYFKITKGKRLFKMTPIHHHFELSNFTEGKICTFFSAVTIIGGTLAVILFIYA